MAGKKKNMARKKKNNTKSVAKNRSKNEELMEIGRDTLPNAPEHETIVDPEKDLYNKFVQQGSLDPKDHVLRTDKSTEEIRKKLIKTGRYHQLSSSLSTALVECGWKTDIENYCKWVLKKNPNMTQRQLVEVVRMHARNLVPPSIKQNLAENIQNYYLEDPSKNHSDAKKQSSQGEKSSSASKIYSQSGKSYTQEISLHCREASSVQNASCSGETCSNQNTANSRETSNTQKK